MSTGYEIIEHTETVNSYDAMNEPAPPPVVRTLTAPEGKRFLVAHYTGPSSAGLYTGGELSSDGTQFIVSFAAYPFYNYGGNVDPGTWTTTLRLIAVDA